jgi:hypothetical protein
METGLIFLRKILLVDPFGRILGKTVDKRFSVGKDLLQLHIFEKRTQFIYSGS